MTLTYLVSPCWYFCIRPSYLPSAMSWTSWSARLMDDSKREATVAHLVNPLDNAINEKCPRIKRAFFENMDEYSAYYYIIGGHSEFNVRNSNKKWYKQLKVILLPRDLVKEESLMFTV